MTDQDVSVETGEESTAAPTLAQARDEFANFISEKLKSYAEQNIAAALEFVRLLNEATTFQAVIQIQTEFMQAQLQSFGEQAKEFSEIYIKAGSKVLNMPFHMSS